MCVDVLTRGNNYPAGIEISTARRYIVMHVCYIHYAHIVLCRCLCIYNTHTYCHSCVCYAQYAQILLCMCLLGSTHTYWHACVCVYTICTYIIILVCATLNTYICCHMCTLGCEVRVYIILHASMYVQRAQVHI